MIVIQTTIDFLVNNKKMKEINKYGNNNNNGITNISYWYWVR